MEYFSLFGRKNKRIVISVYNLSINRLPLAKDIPTVIKKKQFDFSKTTHT